MKVTSATARQQWAAHRSRFEQLGIHFEGAVSYLAPEWASDYRLAADALPAGVLEMNSGVPAFLATTVDPEVIRIILQPTAAAEVFGEQRRGTWTDEIIVFQVVEHAGDVSSYGDHANNGHVSVNSNWPQRQSYLFQTIKEYGDREVDRAGLGRLALVAELDRAAADVMNRFMNKTYLRGVAGMQNYGMLNDPNLPAPITASTKTAGGTSWINSSGVIVATANEVYADIQALFNQLVIQSGGTIDMRSQMVLALSPLSYQALTITNSFGISVQDLLQKNFPNIRWVLVPEYGVKSTSNPDGVVGGNLIQLIATTVKGVKTGFGAYNERMRNFPPVRALSSTQQKVAGGTWGVIIRMPMAIASMVGA